MLQVQEYLNSGKTFDDLSNDFAIRAVHHPELSLCILNYNQIESPKLHPIVRECRGLVLNNQNFDIVAKSFNRFFNWGEAVEEMRNFNFKNFYTLSKEDGSLCLIYNFNGCWMANTKGSFGDGNIHNWDVSWNEGFCKALGVDNLQQLDELLNPEYCYVAEYCSQYNKVFRKYKKSTMYLLTMFEKDKELDHNFVMHHAKNLSCFQLPEKFSFKSIDDIQVFLKHQADVDKTFEGVVVNDGNQRWKLKNSTYLALHRLRGEGDFMSPKNMLPFILANEGDELLVYFPEVKDKFFEYKQIVDKEYANLQKVWENTHAIENQKDFALAILKRTKFNSLLFQLRKMHGQNQNADHLKQLWHSSQETIFKFLFQS